MDTTPRKMRIRTILWIAAAVLGLAAGSHAAERPNVLFIVSDDLRDHIGCYGNAVIKTPHIDRLAARGVRFDHAYVQYPVCNPSRSSFLSGLRPEQTGVTDNNTPLRDKLPDVVTFPQLLRENGWYSAAFGKIFHLGGGRNEALKAKWMDLPKSWDEAHAFQATPAGKVIEGRNLTGGALAWCHWGMAGGTDDDQPDGQNARAAIALMENAATSRGSSVWASTSRTTRSSRPKRVFRYVPPESLKLHRDRKARRPRRRWRWASAGSARRSASSPTRAAGSSCAPTTPACRSWTRRWGGCSTRSTGVLWDRHRGDLPQHDHGYLGERDWWNKNTRFERICRAPLIVAAPGVRPGITRSIVEFVDLYPTIADLCGIKPPAGLAGVSLRPCSKTRRALASPPRSPWLRAACAARRLRPHRPLALHTVERRHARTV